MKINDRFGRWVVHNGPEKPEYNMGCCGIECLD